MSWAWLALFLAGHLASLLLINAGPLLGYQHYPELPRLLEAPRVPLVLLLFQSVAVGAGLLRGRAKLSGIVAALPRASLVLGGAVLLLTSAALSRRPASYLGELLLATLIQLVQLGNVVVFAASLSERQLAALGSWFRRVFGAPSGSLEPGGPDRFAWVLAGGVVLAAALLVLLSYQRHPHVPDEVVYLLHARYFAAGALSVPLPPVPEAFNLDLLTYEADRWLSPVPPGWPAILSLGVRLGAPWFVNPVLGGLNVLLAYTLLRELYPRRSARIGTVLLALSPWHLFLAMSLMTHTATLSFALGASVAVARLRRDPRLRWAVLGGACLGVVGLIRPLDGLIAAGVLGLWSLGARGARFRLLPSLALTVATVAVAALTLPYNRALTGSARRFPLTAYTDAHYGAGTNALGFGSNRGLGWGGLDPFPGHGAVDVAVNTGLNLYLINLELLGWATGSLLLLALWAGSGRLRAPDRQLLAVLLAVALVHAFYWFNGGPDFGARYWFLVLLPCIALAGRGIEFLEALADGRSAGAGRRVLAGAAALALAALLLFVPWRAADKYHHYRRMRPDLRRLAAEHRFGHALVLIRGRRHPDYASAAAYNALEPEVDRPLYAWDRGPALRRELVRAYPDRPIWIVAGPTVTGGGFSVVAGPLSGAELLARADSLPAAP